MLEDGKRLLEMASGIRGSPSATQSFAEVKVRSCSFEPRNRLLSGTSSTSASKTESANCPAGKVVVGGGHKQSSNGDGFVAVRGGPDLANIAWVAEAHEVAATTLNWSLTVWAICMDVLP